MKNNIIIILLLIITMIMIYFGVMRADRICSQANDNWNDYRFCMGI